MGPVSFSRFIQEDEYDKKVSTLNPNTFESGIFCYVNGFFSESEDFLRLLCSSGLDILHFYKQVFPYIRTSNATETDLDYISVLVEELDRQPGEE